jgi:hypothetical protein
MRGAGSVAVGAAGEAAVVAMTDQPSAAAYQPVRNPQHKVSWRETFTTWPSVKIEVELLPWHWRFRLYRDDLEPYLIVSAGPLTIAMWANKRWFPLERSP